MVLFFAFPGPEKAKAQVHVLHYSETTGFDHQTRAVSYNMFQQLGSQHSFAVTHDSTGVAFNSLQSLQQYSVVVFSNTSGNSILDSTQRVNFENYMNAGGNMMGIHAATDTYRHSTSNGTLTGTWDFYAETLGGSVQQNPNHVSGTPVYRIDQLLPHPVTASLPDPWFKAEEYYYWENGYLHPSITSILQVEETVGPNNLTNSYDSARSVAWYRILAGGGKSFYTSLGHAASSFTSDTLFSNLIRDGLAWLMGTSLSAGDPFAANGDPLFQIRFDSYAGSGVAAIFAVPGMVSIRIMDFTGRLLRSAEATGHFGISDVRTGPGIYMIEARQGQKSQVEKIILE